MKNFSDLKADICDNCEIVEAAQAPQFSNEVDVVQFYGSCGPGRAASKIIKMYIAWAGVYLSHGAGTDKTWDQQMKERAQFLSKKHGSKYIYEYPNKSVNVACVIEQTIKHLDVPIEKRVKSYEIWEESKIVSKYVPNKFSAGPVGVRFDAPAEYLNMIFELPSDPQLAKKIVDQYKLDLKKKIKDRGLPPRADIALRRKQDHMITYDKAFFAHMLRAMGESETTNDANRISDPLLQLAMMGDPKSTAYARMPKIKFSKSNYGNIYIPIRGQYERGDGKTGKPDRITINYIEYLFGSGRDGVEGLAKTLGHEFRHRAFNMIFNNKEIYELMPPELKRGGQWYGAWGGNYSDGAPGIKGSNGETPEHAMIYSLDEFDPTSNKRAKFINFYTKKDPKHNADYWRALYSKVQSGVARFLMSVQGPPKIRPTENIPPYRKLPDLTPEEMEKKAREEAESDSSRYLFPKLQKDPVVREMYNRVTSYRGYNPTRNYKPGQDAKGVTESIINRLDVERGTARYFVRLIALDSIMDVSVRRTSETLVSYMERWSEDVAERGNWWLAKKYPEDMIKIIEMKFKKPYEDNTQRLYDMLEDSIEVYDSLERQIKSNGYSQGWKYFSYDYIKKDLAKNPDYDPYNPDAEPITPVSAPKPITPKATPVKQPFSSGRGKPATAPPVKQPFSSGRGKPATAPPVKTGTGSRFTGRRGSRGRSTPVVAPTTLPVNIPTIPVPSKASPKKTYTTTGYRPARRPFIFNLRRRLGWVPKLLTPIKATPRSTSPNLTPDEKNLVEQIREIIANIRKDKPYLGDTALIATAVLALFAGGLFSFRKFLFDRKTKNIASQILRDKKAIGMIKDLRRKEKRRVIELLKDPKFRDKILSEL